MIADIALHRAGLRELCCRFGVRRPEVFGSAARGDFNPMQSDIDFLVEVAALRSWAPTRGAPTTALPLWAGAEPIIYAPDRRGESRRDAADTAAKRRRRSLRLNGYDYAQAGAYFVTICTEGRACLFGEVANGTMRLNAAGQLAVTLWNDLTPRFVGIELDAFVVMPNHVHGVIVLPDRTPTVGAPLVGAHDGGPTVGAPLVGAQGNKAATRAAPTIGDVVGAFKSLFTVEYVHCHC